MNKNMNKNSKKIGTVPIFRKEIGTVPIFREFDQAYSRSTDKDSCGVGFIAHLDAIPKHNVIEDAIKILINLEHRGALGGDKSTGDGAGVLIQIPDEFLRKQAEKRKINLPEKGGYAVGMLFLPSKISSAEICLNIIKEISEAQGLVFLGVRPVDIDDRDIGHFALTTKPRILQFFLSRGNIENTDFERKLYVIRRLIEKKIDSLDGDYSQFYIVSLSSKTICYKGLLTGNQLLTFFKDFEDIDFKSAFAIVHQRFSTNTLPTWNLAQPFRYLAHNGEINTLRGNINHIKSRENMLKSDLLGDDIEKIKPVIIENGSDSAIFDNVLELLFQSGRDIAHSIMMMVPEAWGEKFHMSRDKRAFYEYHSAFMEPWDGPAAIVFTDARYIGGVLDRNGLRPARFTITKDGVIVLASEAGVLPLKESNILHKGRLQPGKMFLVDLKQHRVIPDNEIKAKISRSKPYRKWLNENRIELRGLFNPSRIPKIEYEELKLYQKVFGYTEEELKMIITPMATRGQEPIGSMGNDASLAVFSDKPQLLYSYFKQLFAQVTNPAIDPYREELVMSLMSFVGKESNLLEETPEHCKMLKLYHPILTQTDMIRLKYAQHNEIRIGEIDITFDTEKDYEKSLSDALEDVFYQSKKLIEEGKNILILTDKNITENKAPIPALLATAGLHHFLIKQGLRTKAGIIVETGEAREIMHFALLIGYGANAICPYIAFATIRDLTEKRMFEIDVKTEIAGDNYIIAIKKGLLKTLSRMGISTIRSYFGAQIFEAIGLSKKIIDKYFCNTVSRLEGIGLKEIAMETLKRHTIAFKGKDTYKYKFLDVGGRYHLRVGGETHLWSPEVIYKIQLATQVNDYEIYKDYAQLIDNQNEKLKTLRGLMEFVNTNPIPIEEVEPIEKILPRFVTAAMSLGSISKEAHEAIAIAMNRIGGRSNSGEGGEDPVRYKILENGDSKISKIKQVASGRFGVTIEYLANASELQIKIAQGAKPGEGGQLPGHKVSKEIARVRHTTPGVTLISPPPHHDIYSIEDIAQLIYDLKCANPAANVSVKLVSEVGVGTVASGVAKAKADLILISGYDGGTGASPLTSIQHAGIPWELGLAETQQSLVANNLRDRVILQVDGQLRTGRDLAIACLLGAEEFGFGTIALVTLGCIMMRKCHLNTCPVGVATQDERLRKRFPGKPEYVVNFFKFIAQELREYMALLGFRTIDEMVGRTDKLAMKKTEHYKAKKLDYSKILYSFDYNKYVLRKIKDQEHDLEKAFDIDLIKQSKNAIEKQEKVKIKKQVRNIHRTIGTMLSGEIAKKYGNKGLADDTIEIELTGSAGQSLGAFLANGITIKLYGESNDYLGKGMSGGKIIVLPKEESRFIASENIIVGNTCLYGATGGEVYIYGNAGERFGIRNSGAIAVTEGVGDHGCEYMTGGIVVILGQTGNNFAAGMSGGIAYVYDPSQLFDTKCNLDMVDLESVWSIEDRMQLKKIISKYYEYTKSEKAQMILENWEAQYPLFVKVMPIDYKNVLERMKIEEAAQHETVSSTEEVYDG